MSILFFYGCEIVVNYTELRNDRSQQLGCGSARVRRLQIVVTDPVGEQDEPVNRLPFDGGKLETIRQQHGCLPVFGPAAMEIDQVARGALSTFLVSRPPNVFSLTAHIGKLMQTGAGGRVKKA